MCIDTSTHSDEQRDIQYLVNILRGLVDLGHSVIVIEHQMDLIAASDWIIELGKGGGNEGGRLVFEGSPKEMFGVNTATADSLRAMRKTLEKRQNLKNINYKIVF